MIYLRNFLSLTAVIFFSIFIIGCDDNGGGGTLEPFADEPMILESVLCLEVDDARPVAITNAFFSDDERIYIWLYWVNLDSTSTVEAEWISPETPGAFHKESQVINSDSGHGITWFYINRPVDGFVTGNWTVNIYLDGQFERSHLFSVTP